MVMFHYSQIAPSFGHQPVIFNPQGGPLQTPQTYFHPNGPQVRIYSVLVFAVDVWDFFECPLRNNIGYTNFIYLSSCSMGNRCFSVTPDKFGTCRATSL